MFVAQERIQLYGQSGRCVGAAGPFAAVAADGRAQVQRMCKSFRSRSCPTPRIPTNWWRPRCPTVRRSKRAAHLGRRDGSLAAGQARAAVAARRMLPISAASLAAEVNSQMSDFGARSDGEVDIYWQLHNLGAGDVAQSPISRSPVPRNEFPARGSSPQVGRRCDRGLLASRSEPPQPRLRRASGAAGAGNMASAPRGLIRHGRPRQYSYDPLEPLIAERDLNSARTALLNAVIGYNKAEFQLFWAMGQPPLASTGQWPVQFARCAGRARTAQRRSAATRSNAAWTVAFGPLAPLGRLT